MDPGLRRQVRLEVTGLRAKDYRLSHWRIDAEHGNVAATWQRLGGGDWPDEEQWRRLAEADRLAPVEQVRVETADGGTGGGTVEVALDLPMPAISYLELCPVRA